MAKRDHYVRVLLCGCSHRPRFSGMNCPVKGDTVKCHACQKERVVFGVITGWQYPTVVCTRFTCTWRPRTVRLGKKRLFALLQRHADWTGHTMHVTNDGVRYVIKPKEERQLTIFEA